MRDHGVNCEELQRAVLEGRGLTREQSDHIETCDACMDAVLTAMLDTKPDVEIPVDFAARFVAGLPERPEKQSAPRTQRPWGVISAMAVVLAVMVVCFAGSPAANSWVGLVFVMLIATEIAGLALWLGPRWMGR